MSLHQPPQHRLAGAGRRRQDFLVGADGSGNAVLQQSEEELLLGLEVVV
jgi:hypothetical protein